MRAKLSTLCVAVLVTTAVATAGIPEPDVVLYGSVSIDGRSIMQSDDVTVIARVSVNSQEQEVGRYHMGDNPLAGDDYSLRIHMESLYDGAGQSSNKALVNQTATIYVQDGSNAPQKTIDVNLSARGLIAAMDLALGNGNFVSGDLNCDSSVDFADIDPFVVALIDQGLYEEQYADCRYLNADINGDNSVNFADIDGFVTCLIEGECP